MGAIRWRILLAIFMGGIAAENSDREARFIKNYNPEININNINKVTLSQNGYIQYLRYVADVPAVEEFTFCLWIRSDNLTYDHPLISYSKNESERYIRAWISPRGREINLAIMEEPVFKIPSYFRENRWYHICQSWDSQQGHWAFYLNGKLKESGYEAKTIGLTIPEGGDIAVGQELTDIDRGLDDGIEGDVYGFNLVLASSTSSALGYEGLPNYPNPLPSLNGSQKRFGSPSQYQTHSKPIPHINNALLSSSRGYPNLDDKRDEGVPPSVLSYFTVGANRSPKGVYFVNGMPTFLKGVIGWNKPPPSRSSGRIQTIEEYNADGDRRAYNLQKNPNLLGDGGKIPASLGSDNIKPLGLQLVESSYNCALSKGSPINHRKVIVSWTRTPVRVFGGAILSNVSPFCWERN